MIASDEGGEDVDNGSILIESGSGGTGISLNAKRNMRWGRLICLLEVRWNKTSRRTRELKRGVPGMEEVSVGTDDRSSNDRCCFICFSNLQHAVDRYPRVSEIFFGCEEESSLKIPY